MTLRCTCSVPPPRRLLHWLRNMLLPVAAVAPRRRRDSIPPAALERDDEVAVELLAP